MNNFDDNLSREKAFEIIKQLRGEYGERASLLHTSNEAQTRLLVINEVLKALGWDISDFNPESRTKTGYIDYLMTVDGVPQLIVEAKRINSTFGSSSKRNTKSEYKIRYLRSVFGPNFKDVLTQAERYSTETGVPFAMITNGVEWMLTQLGPVPGFPDRNDLHAVYFNNLFTDDFRFDLFWELLARQKMAGGSLNEYFTSINSKEAEFCESPRDRVGDLEWQTPIASSGLREFYDLFLDEMTDPKRRNMLKHCYVTSSRLDQYQGELRRALRDAAPDFLPDPEELIPGDTERLVSRFTGDKKGRVVIVTGSVGCGKSTLVARVLLDEKEKLEDKRRIIPLVINLIDELDDEPARVVNSLWRHLTENWSFLEGKSYERHRLKLIFGREVRQLKSGSHQKVFENDENQYYKKEAELLESLSQDPERFFTACWRYYRQKGKGIVVFFDNVDQTSVQYQESVYQFSHKLARITGATVIVTMREFTFFRGREAGFLDVRTDDTVYHLSAPDLTQVISKRIAYIERYTEEDERIKQWRKKDDWKEFQNSNINHANMLRRAFILSSEARDKIELFGAVSWHDVRQFFRILRHTHVMLGSSSKDWALSDILAVLMVPFRSSEIQPVIANIFQPPYRTHKCYFLGLRLLLVQMYGQKPHDTRKGTSYLRLIDYMKLYGYQKLWTTRVITELVRERFLECVDAPAAEAYTKNYEVSKTHSYRPSPLAYKLIESILTDSIYLSLIGNELPFHDSYYLKEYIDRIEPLLQISDDQRIEKSIIELLPETDLAGVVASYLIVALQDEQPPKGHVLSIRELKAVENHIAQIAEQLKNYSPRNDLEFDHHHHQPPLPLFADDNDNKLESSESVMDKLPIPEKIDEIRIQKSAYAPLIFWALVARKMLGYEWSSGVELTDIINRYLVNENDAKAPNNVSRALRSEVLKIQNWLSIRAISPRKKSFALADRWETEWVNLFDIPAPKF